MNFDMAAEELSAAGTPVRSIAVTDDVASAPKGRIGERRGIAGDFFVFKIAGAAADRMLPLEEVDRLARHANASTRTMGVALSACSLPQTRKPNFEIPPEEMEIGMGLHGEPGIRRVPLETADDLADTLVDTIVADLGLRAGDEVAVLVNGLGSTSMMELYLLHRKTQHILKDLDIRIVRNWVGEYATSLEMAGASITLLRLDDELRMLLDHPCRSIGLTVGEVRAHATRASRLLSTNAFEHVDATGAGEAVKELATSGDVTPTIFRQMMRNVGSVIVAEKDWLSELDGVIGDGDHGVTMEIGWIAVSRALDAAPSDETIEATCKRMAKAFLDAVGASSGPLYATAFLRAGTAVGDRLNLDADALANWIAAASQGIRDRGRAEPGDKTMVDAWAPAADAARRAAESSASTLEVIVQATAGAKQGMERTADIPARRGRASKLGDRSLGHIDPGAASTYLTLRAMADALKRTLG